MCGIDVKLLEYEKRTEERNIKESSVLKKSNEIGELRKTCCFYMTRKNRRFNCNKFFNPLLKQIIFLQINVYH